MSDSSGLVGGGRPRWLPVAALAMLTCLALCGAEPAQPAGSVVGPRPVAPVAPASPGAATKPQPRTARQFCEQLAVALKAQKTPWQGYATYCRIVGEYAVREATVKAAGAKADAGHARNAALLRQMVSLLAQMGEQAKVRDEIRRGTSAIPFAKRQPAFAAAGVEHQRLLAEFARLAVVLPSGGMTLRP